MTGHSTERISLGTFPTPLEPAPRLAAVPRVFEKIYTRVVEQGSKQTGYRRKIFDWAMEVADLLDTRYANCEKITLICDNLNTHTKGAFYTAFPPEQARDYIKRINFCYTPKHGSWLNVAECELSCLTSQWLRGHRIGDLEFMQTEIRRWPEKTNAKQRGVDWQFKIADARTKLKSLYPKFQF